MSARSSHEQTIEALRESEQRFRAIFDGTFEFIGLLKPDGTLLEANKTALEYAGVSAAEVMGLLFWETPWWESKFSKAMA